MSSVKLQCFFLFLRKRKLFSLYLFRTLITPHLCELNVPSLNASQCGPKTVETNRNFKKRSFWFTNFAMAPLTHDLLWRCKIKQGCYSFCCARGIGGNRQETQCNAGMSFSTWFDFRMLKWLTVRQTFLLHALCRSGSVLVNEDTV